MTDAAAIDRRPARHREQWEQELRQLLADVSSLPPPARRAITTVLESFLRDDEIESEQTHQLRAAIAILDQRHDPSPAPRRIDSPAPPSRPTTALVPIVSS